MSTPAVRGDKSFVVGEYLMAVLLASLVGCVLALEALGLVALWQWAV